MKITSISNTTCTTFKPDGVLVGADRSGAIRQWRVEDGITAEIGGSVMQFDGIVYAIAVSADGRWIVTSGAGGLAIVWSAAAHQRVAEVRDHELRPGYVCAVDVSNDSKRFASGSHDKSVRIFDIASGARLIPPLPHPDEVAGVKFSPDATRIATVTQNHQFVGIYNTCSGEKLFEIPIAARWAPITPLAWSPNGQKLFVASTGKISCFDTSTSAHSEWTIHDKSSAKVSIVTCGKFIACSAGSSVSFLDSTSHEQIGQLIKHTVDVDCIAVSHDVRYLACGHSTGITVHSLEGFLPEQYLRKVSCLPLVHMSDAVMESWMVGKHMETESILSEEITQRSNPSHYTYAARALVRAHLGEWKTAIKDAETSLQIKLSPIGQIARSVALASDGEPEAALDDFDLAFRDSDPSDVKLLLVIKSILVFVCDKRKQAISRLHRLITPGDETNEGYYFQALGNMYLKQGDYENAVRTLGPVKNPCTSEERGSLTTISFIFNWDFENLERVAWERLCENLYASGSVQELGETLLKMVDPLTEDEKEAAHGRILQAIITRSRDTTLLAWTGTPSSCNSCLPSSPTIYGNTQFTLAPLEGEELERRTAELRTIFPLAEALVTYRWVTRSQPVRFTHFRLLLPCIVFRVKRLRREQENVYRAETAALGDVEFTTADSLIPKEARRLVFVNPWIHLLREAHGGVIHEGDSSDSDAESDSDVESIAEVDAGMVYTPMIEEVPPTAPSPDTDMYMRALQLIARLGQPFSALLLLKQSDGAYKRVAADHQISITGMGNNVPRDIRVEVLEIV